MYRNRLEKMNKNNNHKSNVNATMMGTLVWLLIIDKKSNYREYIKSIVLVITMCWKAHVIGILKGTSQGFTDKGTSERENSLFITFETWLYFFYYPNKALSPSTSVLCLVILLGYIFEKVVIK